MVARVIKSLIRKLMLVVAGVSVCVALIIGVAWYYFQIWITTPLNIPAQGYSYELTAGQTLGHLANRLAIDGVLKYPRLLRFYGRISAANNIHAGEYSFAVGTTPESLLRKLKAGDVTIYQVTLLEGWTYAQALNALAKVAEIEHLLPALTPDQQKELMGITEASLEGWFFPDTYSFSRHTSDVEILKQAHKKMQAHLAKAWAERDENLPFKTPYEALILASIVERETASQSERDQIAGVFVRRLQRGMRLQTDPTVIYGMGDSYKGNISRKNLAAVTPYNTYVINGLPPTPISMPGGASIHAVLHPAPGNALYFVAKGDGTSEFSATLAEHNLAVRRYQLKRRADYRSTPTITPAKDLN